jgi:outer membrane cobalamin receptor
LLAGASSAALPSLAAAQTADVGEVVVTGSRVITNGNNSPTPLTVVSTQQLLDAQPTTVAAALQNLPVFQGSLGQNTGTGGSNAGPNGTANAVNIRNLGLYRTLVLLDGHRVQATSDTGVVTIDLIPQMLLQRVDVVTGGASAVYGSDAISGVVNFVTDTNFNGLKLKAQRGVSEYGDDSITDVGIAVGTDLFDGRGHFEASAEYVDDAGILDMFKRPAGQLRAIEGAGTAANPYRLYSNVRVATTSFGGQIRSGALSGQNFTANGVLSPFVHGDLTGTTGFEVGGDGGYYFNTTMKGGLRAKRAFTRFDYDLTNNVRFYIEGLGAKNQNTFQNQSLGYNNVLISTRDAFLPASVQAQLPANTTFTFAKIPQQLGPHRSKFKLEDYQLSTGLEGEFGDGYKWNIDASHGYALQNWQTLRNVNFTKLYAALDAVVNPANGQIVCSVTLTNPGLYPGCAPLNPFGPTSESAEAIAYITDYTQSFATTNLDELSGSIAGAPFATWAGPVNMALSAEVRRTSFGSRSEVPPTDLQDCTGLRFNCSATTAIHAVTFRNAAKVTQTVKEAALETDIPLLKDAPLP